MNFTSIISVLHGDMQQRVLLQHSVSVSVYSNNKHIYYFPTNTNEYVWISPLEALCELNVLAGMVTISLASQSLQQKVWVTFHPSPDKVLALLLLLS